MKKIIAIFFLSLYLFSATEFKQLFKLPFLIEHYKEHKANNPSTSFFSFLKMHYAHGIVVDDDYDKDMQLPFKTTTDACHFVVFAMPPNQFELQPIATVYKETKKNYTSFSNQLLPNFSANIWQPPKLS